MPTTAPLLIDLAGVARLADVQRPVASVWRSRFATSTDPFPSAVTSQAGRPLFDATSVAEWLARTGHGNNDTAAADAAASAAPRGFDFADSTHVATLDALLTVHAASGESVDELSADQLRERARALDPDDTCLVSEIAAADGALTRWAARLADAAYSPVEASRLLERRHAASRAAAGSAGPLVREAETLVAELIRALAVGARPTLVLHGGVTASLASELISRLGDDVDIVVPAAHEGRAIRRRRLLDGLDLPPTDPAPRTPRLFVARLPSGTVTTTVEVLDALDDLVLGMGDDDRALVMAPASDLIDAIAAPLAGVRTDVLRSQRVRAIVRLPAGLVSSAPRAALALWVLGRPSERMPMADRFTAVADLTDTRVTSAAQADLASDVLAAMGTPREVRSHAFRFARLVRTSSLLAARGELVPVVNRSAPRSTPSAHDLPALLDEALAELGGDPPSSIPSATAGPIVEAATVEHLVEQRHLRLLPGTRLTLQEFAETGWVVVGIDELAEPARVGERRVDSLLFAAQHPSARLTAPGDVVFRTAPTPKAWVDRDGSKVVAYPARVLRIDAADPGGLVPELVAADIETSVGGPAAWRRWRLRRVAPSSAGRLRAALADLSSRREALERRIAALERYRDLLVSGVVAGVVTLTDPAAAAASEPQ